MLHVVTANLNGAEKLEQLLGALGRVTLPLQVIVIDNGSTDESVGALLRFQQGPVQVITLGQNIGVGPAWNLGIRIALSRGADRVLVCGNDTAPMPGTVERLWSLLDEGVMFVTGTCVAPDTAEEQIAPCPADLKLLAAPDFSFFMLSRAVPFVLGQFDAAIHLEAAKRAVEGQQTMTPMGPWDWGLFDSRFFPCLAPSTRVLRDDLTWVAIGDVKAGDGLIGVDENPTHGRASRSYRHSTARSVRYLKAPCVRIVLADGRSVVCSLNHRWLAKFVAGNGSPWQWRTADKLRVGHRLCVPLTPWKVDQSYDGGWLSGMFDGEGCLSICERKRALSFYQNEGAVLDRVKHLLTAMGFPFSIHHRGERGVALEIGRKADMLRFLGQVRPLRLLQRRAWEALRIRSEPMDVTIEKIEDVGDCDVVDLCTSTGTFIAEGIVSHNSYFEDNDFHYRCMKAGVPCLRDPGALVWHECSYTMSRNPEVAQQIREGGGFERNATLFRTKWGRMPQDLDVIQARPLNVTDEQWATMNAGREVMEMDREQAKIAAASVYQRYGVEA